MATTMQAYDTFEGPDLDERKWQYLQVPLPDDTRIVVREPAARTLVADGTVEIAVERFTRTGDERLPISDNTKHLVHSTREFDLNPDGVTRFAMEMAASNIGGDPDDYRSGFAGFTVVDAEHMGVFAHLATSNRIHSMWERLHMPGRVEKSDSYTFVVDHPMLDIDADPGAFHRYETEFDGPRGEIRWFIDGQAAYWTGGVRTFPKHVRVGFGFFTLRRVTNRSFVSLRGQGMIGRWRRLEHSID